MGNVIERRSSRRFTMALPLTVRSNGPAGVVEQQGQTRDVSFRGLYFLADTEFEMGTSIEFVLTLPKEITMAGDVNIRCFGQVVRVEPNNERRGVAARIERYEFLPSSTNSH
jgi:PilZ domain-containing protein